MTDFNDFVVSNFFDQPLTLNHLAKQLASKTILDVVMGDDSSLGTRTTSSPIADRNFDPVEVKAKSTTPNNYLEDAHHPTSRERAPPPPSPLNEVDFYYNEHNRRITHQTLPRLNSLLQKPAGMRTLALYNTWLSCSGWELHDFPVPDPGQDSEVLSLAMAVEIDERWHVWNIGEDADARAEVMLGRWRCGKGGFRRRGSLPPMSPFDHPFHPYWLPEPEVEEI